MKTTLQKTGDGITVKILVGANAYACITHATGSLDVLLSPGKGAAKALEESAAEDEAKAQRLLKRAALKRRASLVI